MATTGILNGTLMAIYIGATKVANLTSNSLQRTKETRETTNKDTGKNKTYKYKRGSSNINASAYFDFAAGYGFEDLFDAIDAETELTVLKSTDETGDMTLQATCLITDLSADFPDDDNSSYSFSLLVSGDWTKSTVV